jgi:hypothetical protein
VFTVWPGAPASPSPPAAGIDVLAEQPPDLHDVLDHCRHDGMTHVILDGTLIESDRLTGVRGNGNDLWFSRKRKVFGGNVQFPSAPDGTPLWVSGVEPGSTPDITAARNHVLPALYKAAADGLPTLDDKGYIGAGIGIRGPGRHGRRMAGGRARLAGAAGPVRSTALPGAASAGAAGGRQPGQACGELTAIHYGFTSLDAAGDAARTAEVPLRSGPGQRTPPWRGGRRGYATSCHPVNLRWSA